MNVENFILEFWAEEHESLKKAKELGHYFKYQKPFFTPSDELTDDEIIAGWETFANNCVLTFPINRKLSTAASIILFQVIELALVHEEVWLGYDKLLKLISKKDKRTLQKKIEELEESGLVSADKDDDGYYFKVNREEVNNLLDFDFFEID